MRNLQKLNEPQILIDNFDNWTLDFTSAPTNKTYRFRYRHKDIKGTLKTETGFKCIYCESKIGHNTPGDVEHIIPTSKNHATHFVWSNLSIACTECNRRKDNYYEENDEFLNPYTDDVENMLIHLGPIVSWRNGEARAEITLKTLNLNGGQRIELFMRKIEKIEEITTAIERYQTETNAPLKKILEFQLKTFCDKDSEYSAMAIALFRQKGINLS